MPSTELDGARRHFETRISELRRSMNGELGLRPRRRGWWVLLVAAAVGLALGQRARAKRRQPEERQ